MSNVDVETAQATPPRIARMIHRFSAVIILGWLVITVALVVFVPPLEKVEAEHLVSLTPKDAPSIKALDRLGEDFKSPGAPGSAGSAGSAGPAGASAMIVLEGQTPLGDDAHQYYASIIRQLRADPKHVLHIQDYWGDPLTQAAAISADGKAAYVELTLAGNPGQTLGNESIKSARDILARTPAPPTVKAYLTGPAAVIADMGNSGDRSVAIVTLVSISVICLMLLFVYRSIFTVILLLLTVFIELQVARGVVALLGDLGLVGLTTYAVNLLVSIGLAAGTDYGIFFVGRYQEARQAGEDKRTAYFTTYHGTAKVVLASGLTIAGAVLCLSFTRLPYFQPLGVPCAIGIFVAVAVALTLVPAVLAAGSRFGLFDPKRKFKVSGWRRIGTALVRWPAPILVATIAVTLVGLLALPGFKPSYNDQAYLPNNIAARKGLAAAERHFPQSRMMMPEILLVEADHDLRDSADFLVLNKLAKGILAVPGISRVQAITRPEGTPIEHATIPYLMSLQQGFQQQTFKFQEARMNDMLEQAEDLAKMIAIMKHMYGLMSELNAVTHAMTGITHQVEEKTNDLRDHIADFEDFFRPLRGYFYWEKHCYDIPICWSLRSIFDSIDGIDEVTEKLHLLVQDLDLVDILMPQLLAQFPPQIAIMESMRTMLLTMHSTMSGIFGQMDSQSDNSSAMGQAYDASKNDDSFYLPPAVFKSPGFKEVMKVFLSPNGKTVRMFISQRGDPATPEGIARVDQIKSAAEEALKGTPLEDSKIYLTGTAAITKDLVDGSKFDLLIAGVGALCLILVIMLIVTRSFIASLVIVGTVLISMGASFGLSVLVWQYLLGTQIHWMVVAMSVIVLLAVGSDYNLLLVSRMKEEIAAGLNTGIIRAMGGTGRVVTNAGLVFAFTMSSMIVSDLRVIGQVGTTIGMGLLFDTLIVRAFMTPSIAALLGRWFWWPQRVRPRPASALLRPIGPRPVVRALLLGQGQQR